MSHEHAGAQSGIKAQRAEERTPGPKAHHLRHMDRYP